MRLQLTLEINTMLISITFSTRYLLYQSFILRWANQTRLWVMTTAKCREVGSWPLLKKGRTTQNKNPRFKKKFKSIKQRIFLEAFVCILSPNLASILGKVWSLMGFWPLVCPNSVFLLVFRKTPSFWVKVRCQIFQNIHPRPLQQIQALIWYWSILNNNKMFN